MKTKEKNKIALYRVAKHTVLSSYSTSIEDKLMMIHTWLWHYCKPEHLL